MMASTILSLSQVGIHENNDEIPFDKQSSFSNPLRNNPIPRNAPSRNTISFRNIKYEKGNGFFYNFREFWCVPPLKHEEKSSPILDNISGIFKPGLNAIMGPSGCGKSSLIDVLANRKTPKSFSGEVFLDGQQIDKSFKYVSGYVVQDDILMGTLTVKQNIMFSLNTRLRTKLSKEERNKLIDEVLIALQIKHLENKPVGTELTRGISGGERKRTCIAMELILKPKVLFLDEPTTGTIIFSIHQPRYSIFKLFDRIVLMCKGKIVYNDSPNNVVPYFNRLGFERDPHDSPPDFLLDILVAANRDTAESRTALNTLVRQYQRTKTFQQIPYEIDHQIRLAFFNTANNKNQNIKKSFFDEFRYISKRIAINTKKHKKLVVVQMLVSIFISLLIGLVFFNMPKTVDPGIQHRLGPIFMIVSTTALVIVILIFVIMMVFSGFIVDLSGVKDWVAWIKWLSAFRYASNMLTINEFRDITFCLANMTSICPTNGTDILKSKNINYQTDWDRWQNILALAAMALFFYGMAFIQLKLTRKTK
ncbi:unnamed protein product [Adineta steineri]|uniref:ABC transporter domain-containing protein n=1 Tax=Adineta steineri TaxID=433720 RepID=A0A818MY13_9BILA|nr:unnamed protein product [Adineta steineri]CAF3597142.1 unnamed protein product [Adineta steineri]